MKKFWSKWKIRIAFILVCCIVFNGVAGLPIVKAGLETEAKLSSDMEAEGPVDRTQQADEVGIEITEFIVQDASNRRLNCTGPKEDGGANIYDASNNSYYDVAKVKFQMKIRVEKDWDKERELKEGDYILLQIPEGFSSTSKGTMGNGSVSIAEYEVVENNLKITFTDCVNAEEHNNQIQGGMNIEMTFDPNSLKGKDKTAMVLPDRGPGNLAVKLILPAEPDTIDGISKSGDLDINTNKIIWTVMVGTAGQSKGASLAGVELTETLPDELEQTEVTAKNAAGDDVTITEADGKLQLSGDTAIAPVIVRVTTSIKAQALQNAIKEGKSDLLLTNKVSMGSSDDSLKFGGNTSAESDVTVKLSPQVKKEGVQIDSNTIRWTIKVNHDNPVRVYKGYVKDALVQGLTYKEGSITCNGKKVEEKQGNSQPDTDNSWPAHELWVNGSDSQILYFYMAEDTNEAYTITFDTTVSDDFVAGNQTGEDQTVHNEAEVFAQFPTGEGTFVPVQYGIPGVDTVFNTAKVNKEVSADGTKARGQLTWTIYPSVRKSSYTTATIEDKIQQNQEYCQDTLQIYENIGGNWTENTAGLQLDGVFTVDFADDTATLTLVYTQGNAAVKSHSTKLSDYKIQYQTNALTYLQTNNKNDEYKNTAVLTVIGNDGSKYTSTGSASAELQNSWASKSTKFEYLDDGIPCFHYTITVNSERIKNLTNVIIKDNIEEAVKISGSNENISKDWEFDHVATKVVTENGQASPEIGYSANKREVEIKFASLSEKVIVELYAKYVGGNDKLTADGGSYKNQMVYSDNTAEVKSDEVADKTGDPISVTSNTESGEKMNNMLVQKKCTGTVNEGGMRLIWQVLINPNSGMMGMINIKDAIDKTQKYVEDSVKLYEVSYKDGKMMPVGPAAPLSPKFGVDEAKRYMELTINAGNKPLIIEYQTLLLDSSMTTATNSIEASGNGVSYGKDTGEKELSGGDWGSMISAGTLILKKQDASIGSDMPLEGAEFMIYADKGGKNPIDVGRTAGDKGEAVFFGLDVLAGKKQTYYYKETGTPPGYEPDNEIHEVVVEKGVTTTYVVENIRKTIETDQKSQVRLTKKFIYADAQGVMQEAAEKQAAFQLTFYPFGKDKKDGAKVVSLVGENGSYVYYSSARDDAVTEIKNNVQTGQIEIEGLPWGYYGIKEIKTASGFSLDEQEHIFVIDKDNMEVQYQFGDNPENNNAVLTNTAIRFRVAKYEEGTENPIQGIHFQICKKSSGAVVRDALNNNLPYEWDTDGKEKTIYNLPAGDYLLHEDAEKSNNLNYAVKDVEFTVLANGEVNTPGNSVLKIYNKAITLKIAKVDQFDAPVSGATIKMTGTDYNQSKTTTQDKHILSFEKLKRNGTYTLEEDTPPDAEHLAIKPITVKVSGDGNSFRFTQKDENGNMVALKLDEDGTLHVIDRKLFIPVTVKKANGFAKETFLADAEFKLYGHKLDDGSDNYIEFCDIKTGADGSWEMSGLGDSVMNPFDKGKKLLLGLKPGRYYLEETASPDGYKALPDGMKLRFIINDEGIIELEEAVDYMTVSGTVFTISDMPYTLRIQPLEFNNGYDEGMGDIDLNGTGAVYTVTGRFIGNNAVTSIEMDGTKKGAFTQANSLMGKLIPNEVYMIAEKKAPEGYIAPDPVYVKINNQGEAVLCDGMGNTLDKSNSYCKVENPESVMAGAQNGYDGLVKIYHGKTRAQLIKYTTWNSDKKKEETEKKNYKTLSGVIFMLKGNLAGGQEEKEYRTDEDGKIVFDGDLVEGEEYVLTEMPYAGYREIDDICFRYSVSGITLTSADAENAAVSMQEGMPAIEIINESEQNTSLQFWVYDLMDGAGLAGAKFKMTCVPADGSSQTETIIETSASGAVCSYNTAGEVHKKVMAAGEAFVTDLKPGIYTLSQIEAPYGYHLGEAGITITFKVDEDAKNRTIVINGENIKNAAYHLEVTEGSLMVTDEGICNKRAGGTVVIDKQDYDDGAPLNDVGFAIYRYKEADNIFELLKNLLTGKAYKVVEKEWTEIAAEEGKLTITGLEWGKYYIVETNPLTGYAADETRYDFEIGKDALTQGLTWTPGTIINKKIQMIILPTNAMSDQMNMTGCRMRISGKFQNPDVSFIEWEETEKGYVIAGMLLPGEVYTLERMEILPGYNSSRKIQFKYNGYGKIEMVSGDGTDIIVEEDGTVKLVQTLDPLKIRILKTDEDGKLLAGASLSLYVKDETGAKLLVAEITTDGSAWELTGDKYSLLQVGAACVLMEKSAPEGYALAEDVVFIIEDNAEWQEYTMTDKRKQGGNTESGIGKDPDNETEKNPDNETEKDPDDGTEKDPDDGTEKDPDNETEKDSDKETNEKSANDEQNNGKNSNSAHSSKSSDSANRDGDNESDSAAILPQTGREARTGFYVVGGILVVAGMLILLYDRRKKKE